MNKSAYLIHTVLLSMIGLCVVGQLYLPIPVMSQLQQEIQAKAIQAPTLIAIFGYSYACGFLVFGPLSDKYGKKPILITGMTGLVFLTFLVSKNNDFLFITRMLQGFFAASYPPLILAYMGQHFPEGIKNTAISAMSFAFLSAVILSQLFIVYIAGSSFFIAEKILMGVYFTAILIIFITIKSDKKQTSNSLLSVLSNIPKVLCNKQLIRFFSYTFFLLLAFVSFYLILSSNPVLSKNELFFIRLIGLPAMLLTFVAPRLNHLLGVNKVISLAFSLQMASLLMAGIFYQFNFSMGYMLSSFLLSSATALLVPTLISCVGQSSNPEERGTAISLYTFILFCGASSAPLLVNKLSSYLTTETLFFALSFVYTLLLLSNLFRAVKNR